MESILQSKFQVVIFKDVQNLVPSDSWFYFLAIDFIVSLIHKHNLYSGKLEQVSKGAYQNPEIASWTGLYENKILVVSVSKFSLQLTATNHTIYK